MCWALQSKSPLILWMALHEYHFLTLVLVLWKYRQHTLRTLSLSKISRFCLLLISLLVESRFGPWMLYESPILPLMLLSSSLSNHFL